MQDGKRQHCESRQVRLGGRSEGTGRITGLAVGVDGAGLGQRVRIWLAGVGDRVGERVKLEVGLEVVYIGERVGLGVAVIHSMGFRVGCRVAPLQTAHISAAGTNNTARSVGYVRARRSPKLGLFPRSEWREARTIDAGFAGWRCPR